MNSTANAVDCPNTRGEDEIHIATIGSSFPNEYEATLSAKINGRKDIVGFCYRDDYANQGFTVTQIRSGIAPLPGNIISLRGSNFEGVYGGSVHLEFNRLIIYDRRRVSLDLNWSRSERRWILSVNDSEGRDEINWLVLQISTRDWFGRLVPTQVSSVELWRSNHLIRDLDTDDLEEL